MSLTSAIMSLSEYGGSNAASYRLIRSCDETPGEGDTYARGPARTRLLRLTDSGEVDITDGMEGILNAVLPFNLKEVFFTNGDDVQRFIAGGQHGQKDRQEAVHLAIRRLLGLENVETVEGHFTAVARRFRRESTATGGNELQSAGEELDRIEGELTVQNAKLGTIKPESTEGVGRVSVLKRQEGAPLNLG